MKYQDKDQKEKESDKQGSVRERSGRGSKARKRQRRKKDVSRNVIDVVARVHVEIQHTTRMRTGVAVIVYLLHQKRIQHITKCWVWKQEQWTM